jgi:hypothetical protein
MDDCPRVKTLEEQLDDMGPEFIIGVAYLIGFYALAVLLYWLLETTTGAKPRDL